MTQPWENKKQALFTINYINSISNINQAYISYIETQAWENSMSNNLLYIQILYLYLYIMTQPWENKKQSLYTINYINSIS